MSPEVLHIRVTFLGADTEIRSTSLTRLTDVAAIMVRHPRLLLEIEAHTGRNAPPAYAPHFTSQRGRAVALHLASLGVCLERCFHRGWGKDIAIAAGWQQGLESARAELYFSLDGLLMPRRPHVYDGRELPLARSGEGDGFMELLLSMNSSFHPAETDGESDMSSSTEDSDQD